MKPNDLESLLTDYRRSQPHDRALSDDERAKLQREIKAQLTTNQVTSRIPARPRAWIFGCGSGAIAAALLFALLIPDSKHTFRISAHTGGGVRAGERFEVRVETSKPVTAYLIVLDEMGHLSILDSDGDGTKVDHAGILGSYSVQSPALDGHSARRTHAIVVGCSQPVELERLAREVPDTLKLGATIPGLCEQLEADLGCKAAFTEIPPL